jgi:arylsulfatase A
VHNDISAMNRRNFLKAVGGATLSLSLPSCGTLGKMLADSKSRPPNFIIIFADDLGYTDLGCFGSKTIATPQLDRMAAEGMKFTDFHVCDSVCTPSRAALLTGCYPPRVGLTEVLSPYSGNGISSDEITIAEILKSRGYATACIGKWHLGYQKEFLPTRHGFDYYFGLPYSNDMSSDRKPGGDEIPLMRGEEIVEERVNQDTLTRRYTEESIRFIRASKDRPFFLYLPHTFPHVPLHASDRFRGKSKAGLYGDAVEEIDWSCGQILETLSELKIDENTLVIFTSDNGPKSGDNGGTANPLRKGKGSAYEGGFRVPCIMRWPGAIPAASVCSELTAAFDFLPTIARLSGGKPPADRIIDGKDIRPLLAGTPGAASPHEYFCYFRRGRLGAVRSGKWKLFLEAQDIKKGDGKKTVVTNPKALYNLDDDLGETTDVAAENPGIVAKLEAFAEKAREDLGDRNTGQIGKNVRPPGKSADVRPSPR